ncbi:MAG: methionine adenosyltransferase [Phycisphaeraceae bacterium]|nr:methionine adenosyltransferase [Phycisphaeraceae bacterium]
MAVNFHHRPHLFTSESVSMGHPDKISDRISDAILDSLLAVDPNARVACETMVTTGLVVLAGEVTVHNDAAIKALEGAEETVRQAIRDIGYTDPAMKFDADGCAVIRTLHGQSADISMGVTGSEKREQGAGDQGLMFGFACKETSEYMPLPIHLSHRLVERHAKVRRQGIIKGLRPDAKSQVTIKYEGGKPVGINAVVLSTQHTADWNGKKKQAELKKAVIEHIIEPVMPKALWANSKPKIHVNPTGQFEIGGPHGDAGLTGRKIIVDTYGGRGRHGGGAFSGKDPSKVDRSATYMARYIAKNVVAAGLADVCEVQLSYAIGVAKPVSVLIDAQGTAKVDEAKLGKLVADIFPLTPAGIIKHLNLRKPIYQVTSYHGHFGRKPGADGTFTWEKLDMVDKLKSATSRW